MSDALVENGAILRFSDHFRTAPSIHGCPLYDWQSAHNLRTSRQPARKRDPPEFDEVTYLLLNPDIITEKVGCAISAADYEPWISSVARRRLARFLHAVSHIAIPLLRPLPAMPRDFDEDAHLFLNPYGAQRSGRGSFSPSG